MRYAATRSCSDSPVPPVWIVRHDAGEAAGPQKETKTEKISGNAHNEFPQSGINTHQFPIFIP
jgi:hypothetical protein